jgi:hypothetical protein
LGACGGTVDPGATAGIDGDNHVDFRTSDASGSSAGGSSAILTTYDGSDHGGAAGQLDASKRDATTGGQLGGSGGSDGGSTEGSLNTEGSVQQVPPAACAQQEEGPLLIPNYDAYVAALTGSWLLCKTPSVFGTSDEIGLEIDADGNWFKLYLGDAGAIERGHGFDRQGTWDTPHEDGGFFQLNIHIFGSGDIYTNPVFATNPRKLRLNNFGVFIGDYAIDGN